MLSSCTQKYTDESDEKTFRFTFYCDCCGKPYKAAPLPFTNGAQAESDCANELWELTWQKEHTQAFERANYDASYHFFCCPGCGEYVCSDCTISEKILSGDVRDLCRNCYSRPGRRKTPPLRMVTPADSSPVTARKGWCGLCQNEGYHRSQKE